jgi:hypothetical protein
MASFSVGSIAKKKVTDPNAMTTQVMDQPQQISAALAAAASGVGTQTNGVGASIPTNAADIAPGATPGSSGGQAVVPTNTWPGLNGVTKPDGVSTSFWNKYVSDQQQAWAKLPPEVQQQQTSANGKIDPQVAAQQVAAAVGKAFDALPADQKAGFTTSDKQADLGQQALDTAKNNTAANQVNFDRSAQPALQAQQDAITGAAASGKDALADQSASRDRANAALGDISEQYGDDADYANFQSGAVQGKLVGQNAGAATADKAAGAKFQSETDPLMKQLVGADYGANVTADAEGLAAQRKALEFAGSTATGGLNYNAAQSGADPNAVARQSGALDTLQQEVGTGQAQQQTVIDKYNALTDPSVTATERANAEAARYKFESEDQGSRQAQMRDLALRGLNSGGAQIAQQQATQGRLGQERLQAELGLQATAQQRSLAALQGLGTATNAQRASNQTASGMYVDATGALRNQTAAESQVNAASKNAASANNQQTQLAGGVLQGNQANTMRDDGDALSTFNKEQQVKVQAAKDAQAQAEAKRVGELAESRLTGATGVTKGIADRAADESKQGQAAIAADSARDTGALAAQTDLTKGQYSNDQDISNGAIKLGQDNVSNTTAGANSATGGAAVRSNITNAGTTQAALAAEQARLDAELAKKQLGA